MTTSTHPTRRALVRKMRAAQVPLRAIAATLGISVGAVCREVYEPRSRVTPTKRSVIRHIPVIGWAGSHSCYSVPVSLPRVSILENAHA